MGSSLRSNWRPPIRLAKDDTRAAGLRLHFAAAGDEILGLGIETLCREIDQGLACGCRRLADLHAAALDSGRTGCAALVGRERGVAFHEFNLVDADAKLFGGDLRNGNPQALAKIDLAAIQRDGAVAVDGEK